MPAIAKRASASNETPDKRYGNKQALFRDKAESNAREAGNLLDQCHADRALELILRPCEMDGS